MSKICPFMSTVEQKNCVEDNCAIWYNNECSQKKKPFKKPEARPANVMPFGKHVGRTFAEIAKMEDGIGYLKWVRDESIPKSLKDPERAKYKAQNEAMLVEVNKILDSEPEGNPFKDEGASADVPF